MIWILYENEMKKFVLPPPPFPLYFHFKLADPKLTSECDPMTLMTQILGLRTSSQYLKPS